MGWQFAGFFARAGSPVLEAALGMWPECHGRLIADPFPGIGVAVPERALTYLVLRASSTRGAPLRSFVRQPLLRRRSSSLSFAECAKSVPTTGLDI